MAEGEHNDVLVIVQITIDQNLISSAYPRPRLRYPMVMF